MKRYAALALVAFAFAAIPCRGQILQKLEQGLLGGQGQQGLLPGQQGSLPGQQGLLPGQAAPPQLVGNVNLPPGQYMMTNVQSGQAFYVSVQNGQMYLSGSQGASGPNQGLMPPVRHGGLLNGGFGKILQNELQPPQQMPNNYPGQQF